MKKNVKLVKYVLMCAISLGAASTVLTSCKDYDDDINNLQEQIDKKVDVTTFNELKAVVEAIKQPITDVTKDANGNVTLTYSGGTITIPATHTTGTVKDVSIEKEGNDYIVKVDDVALVPKIVIPQPEAGQPTHEKTTVTIGSDGYLYVDNVKVGNKIVNESAPVTTYFVKDELRNIVTIYMTERVDGVDKLSSIEMPLSAEAVTSIQLIPNNIVPGLGQTALFPVIIKNRAATDVLFDYDDNTTKQYKSIYAGNATLKYAMNPSSIRETVFSDLGFMKDVTYVGGSGLTKSTHEPAALQLPITSKSFDKGVMTMKVKGYHFINSGSYADVEGKGTGLIDQTDVIAWKVKNTSTTAEVPEVISNFVPAKRIAIFQDEIKFSKTVADNNALTSLTNVYHKNATKAEKKVIYNNMSNTFEMKYNGSLNLYDRLTPFALGSGIPAFAELVNEKLRLKQLGFDNYKLKYTSEEYDGAEVDQTKRYIQIDENGNVTNLPVNGGPQTAAIGRTPIIRVDLISEDSDGETAGSANHSGTKEVIVASCLIKILIVREDAADKTFTQTFNYELQSVEGLLKYDMDPVFNALGLSKEEFFFYYNTNGSSSTTISPATTHIVVTPYIDEVPAGTGAFNNISISVDNQCPKGEYVTTSTYETTATANAPAKRVIVKLTVNVTYPEVKGLVRKSEMWGTIGGVNSMKIYGRENAVKGDTYEMVGRVEDGFIEYNNTVVPPVATRQLHFELVEVPGYPTPAAAIAAGAIENVSVSTVQGHSHNIQLKHTSAGIALIGKQIKMRAYVSFNDMDERNATANTEIPSIDNAGGSEFYVTFVAPVEAAVNGVTNMFFIDQTPGNGGDNIFGRAIPVYNMFNVKASHKPATFNNIWTGTGAIADANNAFVFGITEAATSNSYPIPADWKVEYIKNASQANVINTCFEINPATGIAYWKFENLNQGAGVQADMNIGVTVKITHDWGVITLPVTLVVKPVTATRPNPLPTMNF